MKKARIIAVLWSTLLLGQTPVAVTLSPALTPDAGQAGITSINVTGSGFPAGTIQPTDVTLTFEPAAGGASTSAPAATVTTVVGTTRRVTFQIPATISVNAPTQYLVSLSGKTSTGTAFTSTNKVPLTINPGARILSVTPASGQTGQTLTVVITGQFTTFVQGSTQASFGAGISVGGAAQGSPGPVTVTSPTTATAQLVISAAAVAGPRDIVVRTGIQESILPAGFTVTSTAPANPVISDFNPKSAPLGTLVNVIGSNLGPNPQVLLVSQAGGTLLAPVGNATATALSFTIPPGAATGPVSVVVAGKTATSTVPLAITTSKSFTISALPGAATLVRGQNVSLAITLASPNGFTSLAALSVSGVPAGVTASFKPLQITAGQTSILTLTAPPAQALVSAAISIAAAADVDGFPVSQSASATVNVIAPTTSFVGRTVVDDPLETPIANVTVTMLGQNGSGGTTGCTGTAVSDSAGNFALRNLGPACTGRQLVGFDGLTATAPAGKYAGVNLIYTFATGQVTASPVLVHLPRIDNQETFLVRQNDPQDQTYAWKAIPGLSVTVYKGTTFSLPGGGQPNPFPLVAVQVPVDRLPDSKPQVATMMLVFIVAFQPANSKASQPVAVFYPNTLNDRPGSNMPLLTLDPTRGQMIPYGSGTVNPEGTQVVPDLIPGGTGKRWGIVDFDWHGQMPNPPDPSTDPSPDPGGGGECSPTPESPKIGGSSSVLSCCAGGCSPAEGDPVDLGTGLMVYNVTDLFLRGGRGSIEIRRNYRSTTTVSLTNNRPFGPNTNHNYNHTLGMDGSSNPAQIALINPDNSRISYARQLDGTYRNDTVKTAVGSVLRILGGGRFEIRSKTGNITEFEADGPLVARQVALVDTNGNRISIDRNPANRFQVLSVTDAVGRQLRFVYDGANRVTSIRDPIGRTITYTYHLQEPGMLASVTDPEGGVTRYEYNGTALVREFNARNIKVYENVYTGLRVSQQTQADGGVYRFHYQFYNILVPEVSPIQLTTVVNPNGRRTTYRFDPTGQLIQVTHQDQLTLYPQSDPRPASGKDRILEMQPSPKRVKSIKGPAQCSSCGNARRGDVEKSFDADGNLLTSRDSLGNTTGMEYEPVFDRPKAIIDPLGARTEMTYDFRGNLLSQKDPNGNLTFYQYNSFGQVIEATNALNQKTKLEYDAFGNLIAAIDALQNKTQFRYDAVSRLVETIDPLGRRTQTFYDKLDRVTKRIDGRSIGTQLAYDALGNLLTLADGRGKTTAFTYDLMNRLATRTDPLGKTDSRFYDGLGNLVKFIDRRGRTSEFKYDQENRLTEEKYVDALVKRFYDAAGRLERIDDSQSGIFTMTYDATGRLLSSAGPTGTVRYRRDALGRVTSREVVGGGTVAYTYDPTRNLMTASMSGASVSYGYDALNRVSTISRANGVDTQHLFDPGGRLLNITHRKAGVVVAGLNYAYDTAGNRISQQSNFAQPLVTQPSLATFNDNNEILTRAGSTFTHDANGNLTSETGNTGPTNYSWDGRGRLSALSLPGGVNLAFTYDPGGMLLKYSDTITTREYVLDDMTNTAEFRINGASQSVLAGRSVDDHVAVVSGSTASFNHADAVNSTVATTDGSGGTTNRFSYEPFGATTPSAPGPEPFSRFTGRLQISDELYYYRARFYSSSRGTFLSVDPVWSTGSQYAYGNNSPAMYTDPTGRCYGVTGALLCSAILFAYAYNVVLPHSARILMSVEVVLAFAPGLQPSVSSFWEANVASIMANAGNFGSNAGALAGATRDWILTHGSESNPPTITAQPYEIDTSNGTARGYPPYSPSDPWADEIIRSFTCQIRSPLQ